MRTPISPTNKVLAADANSTEMTVLRRQQQECAHWDGVDLDALLLQVLRYKVRRLRRLVGCLDADDRNPPCIPRKLQNIVPACLSRVGMQSQRKVALAEALRARCKRGGICQHDGAFGIWQPRRGRWRGGGGGDLDRLSGVGDDVTAPFSHHTLQLCHTKQPMSNGVYETSRKASESTSQLCVR